MVGKVSLLLTLVIGGITIYTFYFPNTPKLSAYVQESRQILPDNTVKTLRATANKPFWKSLKDRSKELKPELDLTSKLDPTMLDVISTFSDERVAENNKAFDTFEGIKQKLRIYIFNNGNREADAVNIEFPVAIRGFYELNSAAETSKPFERAISIGAVRPQSHAVIDIWLYVNSVEKEEVAVNYPEGVVAVKTEQFMPEKSFIDLIAVPLLIVENLIILIIIAFLVVAWFKTKEDKQTVAAAESATDQYRITANSSTDDEST